MQIIKQPNGLYCLFSSNEDDFVLFNATPEEIVEELASDYRKEMEEKVQKIIEKLGAGGKPYYQFTKSFQDALERVKMVHGKNAESLKMWKEIQNESGDNQQATQPDPRPTPPPHSEM